MATTTTRLALSKPASTDLVSAFQATVGTSFDTIDADIVASQGAYAGGTTYHAFDIVTSGGVYYMSKATQTGAAPPGSNWIPLSGLVGSVTATDTSIVVGGTATAPTVATGTLDVIATQHAPAANWSNNSKKITALANATGAQDALALGQVSPLAAITSGALPTVSLSSGTGAQVSTTRDVELYAAITYTLIAGTCAVALSPDNSTYTTLITISPGVASSVEPVQVRVPAGWYIKLTVSNAVITSAVYW